MRNILKSVSSISFFLLFYSSIFATVLPIQLSSRVAESGQIIMAEAIAAESYWNSQHQRIYTAYTMTAKVYMKENSSVHTFKVILPGGEVDGEMEIVSPNISIEIGQEYMLLVETAPDQILNPNLDAANLRMPHFQPYAFVQGVMPYLDGKYVDYAAEEPMEEKEIMERIETMTGMQPTTPDGDLYNPRVIIVDLDNDGVCSTLDCDDNDPTFPKPVGAPCNDGNSQTINDQIQADGCTCAGNAGDEVDCDNIQITTGGGIIRIDNLLAKSEKIEIIGSETNGQASLICDGDCNETHFIEGLQTGNKIVKIWQYGAGNKSCFKEFIVEVTELICSDEDGDNICDIKDCDPDDDELPTNAGTPCDDDDDNTLRDIILIDGCTCAGVPACPVPDEDNRGARPSAITLKNANGAVTSEFIAGTVESEDELIIEGTGFGNTTGTIEFPNSDSGGRSLINIDQSSDIIAWTDTQIRVKIPTRAGTGNINVKNSAGVVVGSTNISIKYSINSLYSSFRSFESKTRQNIKFTNRNEIGGYTLELNSNSGFAFTNVVPAFERALDSWVCASGVNWQIDKSGTTTGFANDGFCVVTYEPNLPVGILGITTSRYKASGNSSCSLYNTVWYLKEFDIQFLPEASMGSFGWNFGPWPPQTNQYDFETIALHELGHAHGLGHVIDNDEVMHYSVSNGVEKRTISAKTNTACKHKVAIGTQPNCISSHEPMTLLVTACTAAEEVVSTSARIKIMLEGYLDQGNNLLKTNLLDNNLLPANQPFNEPPYNVEQAVTIENFPANAVDWLLIELRDESDMTTVIAQKPVLVNTDGTLVDIEGNELITFDNVADANYYIAIFHKSHLPIISSSAQALNDDPVVFDFSATANTTMGTDQQKEINGRYFMSSGDFDGNGIINSLDFNMWKQAGAAVNSYSPADADGNGIINSLDFNLWKANGSKVSILQRN